MTVLEQSSGDTTHGADARLHPRRLRRVLGLLGVVLVTATVVAGLLYRDHYQPLARGSLGGRGTDSGLLELNDGLFATRWVVATPGGPGHFIFSLANRGRFAVRVLSAGDPSEVLREGPLGLTVTRMGNPASRCCTDQASLRFAPFALPPGHERFMRVDVVSTRCEPAESGGYIERTAIAVRYQAWGKKSETSVPLPVPVTRVCPPGRLRPHVDAASDPVSSLLMPSSYNFGVPRGWKSKPLENFGGPASFASWTSPDRKSRVEYEVNGGMAGALYDEHNQPTEAGARDATGCDLTAFRPLHGSAYEYTCRGTPETEGVLRTGVIRIKPYPEGFERIEIRSSDLALVAAFLDSIKT